MTRTERPREIGRFLSNPSVATILSIIGLTATLVCGGLGLVSYIQSNRSRNLMFSVDKARAVVVSSQRPSRLSVSFDGQPVQSDITAAQVAFWNAGNESIKKANILRPLVISTADGTPILEATIRKTSREVTSISLDQRAIREGRLTIDWDILEQNDGAVVQIIYAGNAEISVAAHAVIEGEGQIDRSVGGSASESVILLPTAIMAVVGIGLNVFFVGLLRIKNPSTRRERLAFLSTVLFLFVLWILGSIVLIIYSSPSPPPFGY